MKAIVTGGTGFLGSHLVEMLVDEGWSVIVLARNISNDSSAHLKNVDFKSADISNLDDLEGVFEEVDVVFHCAALSSAWGEYDNFYLTNVQGTRNVLTCCEKFSVKKLIYVSSTSIYFKYKDEINISETQTLNYPFANAYAETKYLGEQVVLNEKKHIDVIIVRPRGIVGDGDVAIMPRILRVAKKGFFPLLRRGNSMVDITYVKNVAHALMLCAKIHGLDGEVFNISNDQPMKVKHLLDFVLKEKAVRLIKTPYFIIICLAWISECFAKLTHGEEPKLTMYGVGLLAYTQTLNIDKAKKVLGYESKYSIEYAVAQYIKWEKNHARNS
ncbi:MAG: NAD-dependent epimerase/dehydratase family protein [Pseudomonadota bacterium]